MGCCICVATMGACAVNTRMGERMCVCVCVFVYVCACALVMSCCRSATTNLDPIILCVFLRSAVAPVTLVCIHVFLYIPPGPWSFALRASSVRCSVCAHSV
jgi:hypothetical protein